MDRITIDAGVGTITAKTDGDLLLQQVLEAFKEKLESSTPIKLIALLTKKDESLSDNEQIVELEKELNLKYKEIETLERKVEDLEESLESGEGLEQIDCGYGNILYKTDNLKLEMYMEELKGKLETVGV